MHFVCQRFRLSLFRLSLFCLSTALLVSAAGFSPTFGQESEQPTEHHEILYRELGQWKGEMKMWPAGPGSEPVTLPVEEKNTKFAGGLWTLSEFTAGPFKGRGHFGYDARKKKYVGVWIDNSTSSQSVMEGSFDKQKDQLVMTFPGIDAATQKPAEMKNVTEWLSKTKRRMTMYQKTTGSKWDMVFVVDYQKVEE